MTTPASLSLYGLTAYHADTLSRLQALGPYTPVIVTDENIDILRDTIAAGDQAAELYPGCITWGITYAGGQRGQMTLYPDTLRAAASFGGDSVWGDWDAAEALLCTDSGEIYDADGDLVTA